MFPQCWWLLHGWWLWKWELAGSSEGGGTAEPQDSSWILLVALPWASYYQDSAQRPWTGPRLPELLLPPVAPVPSSFPLEFCLVISILGILAKSSPTLQWSIAYLPGPWRLHVKMVNELQSCLSSLARPGPWRLQVRMVSKPQSSLARPPQRCSFSCSG